MAKDLSSEIDALFEGTTAKTVSDYGEFHFKEKVKTPVPHMNALLGGGIPFGTMVEAYGEPGCFTGDTRIMTLDGESHPIEELYKMYKDDRKTLGSYGAYPDGGIRPDVYDSVYLAKWTRELVSVEIDNDYVIRCTPDHPFLLRSGEYKNAENLLPMDELMPILREHQDYFKGDYRECTIDSSNVRRWTHREVGANLVSGKSEDKNQCHHKDGNKNNNLPINLEWLTSSEHSKVHYSDKVNFIEGSKKTRFTSEQISERNRESWKDDEYREKMVNGLRERSLLQDNNFGNGDPDLQATKRRGKVLSFINRLLIENKEITLDNYETLSKSVDTKYRIRLRGIAKAYNVTVEELPSVWDNVISDASVYNHKVTKVVPLLLDEDVPVYGLVDAGLNHNYSIALDNNHGVIVSNSGKSSFSYETLANFQKDYPNGIAIIVDTETAVDEVRMRYLGCDNSRILRIPASTIEHGFGQIFTILDKKYNNKKIRDLPIIILWDTISVAVSEKETANKDNQHAEGMMGHAKLIKSKLSLMLPYFEGQPLILILLNQVTTKINGFGGASMASGGGWARRCA